MRLNKIIILTILILGIYYPTIGQGYRIRIQGYSDYHPDPGNDCEYLSITGSVSLDGKIVGFGSSAYFNTLPENITIQSLLVKFKCIDIVKPDRPRFVEVGTYQLVSTGPIGLNLAPNKSCSSEKIVFPHKISGHVDSYKLRITISIVKKPDITFTGGLFCGDDELTLKSSSGYDRYYWSNDAVQFKISTNESVNIKYAELVAKPAFDSPTSFRVKASCNIANLTYASDVSKSATFYPAKPVVTIGRETAPSCPESGDGTIPITISGQATQYEFTICRTALGTTGDPVICYNWVSPSRSISEWLNTPYDINNSITVLNRTENGVSKGSSKLSIREGDYSIYVEPHSAIDRCGDEFTATVPVDALAINSVELNSPTCLNGNNGSIKITTSHGKGPYTYEANINSGFNDLLPYTATTNIDNGTITGLSPNTYYLKVTDQCAQTAFWKTGDTPIPVEITNRSDGFAIIKDGSSVGLPVQCATSPDQSTGSAQVFVENSVGTVTYQLLTPTGAPPLNEIGEVLKDDDGMDIIPAATTTGSHQFDNIYPEGEYKIYATNVIDGQTCQDSLAVEITTRASLGFLATPTAIACKDAANGQIDIVGSGGSADYLYAIDGGSWQTSSNISDLDSGSYQISIKDARIDTPDGEECIYTQIDEVIVDEPKFALKIDEVKTLNPLECNNDQDGQIEINISGGTPNYNYILKIGESQVNIKDNTSNETIIFSGLGAANYTVVAYDKNGQTDGCIDSVYYDLTQPQLLEIDSISPKVYQIDSKTVSENHISCFKATDGELTVITIGGTAPYQVTVDTTQQKITTDGGHTTFTELTAGDYTVEVVDTNDCETASPITLFQPNKLLLDQTTLLEYAGGVHIRCHGESNGELTVNSTGGTWPHTVSVNGEDKEINESNLDVTFFGLSAGAYDVDIIDANGCTDSREVTLIEPDVFEVFSIDIPTYFGGHHLQCRGDYDAVATIKTTGGTYEHTIQVTGDASAYDVTETIGSSLESGQFPDLAAGEYTVSITDANGCTNTDAFTITEPENLQLNVGKTVIVKPECFGDNSGSLTLEAQGGVLSNGTTYHYEIDHQYVPSNLPFPFDSHQELDGVNITFSNLIAGNYLVSVYDHFGNSGDLGQNNGCLYQEFIEITTVNQLAMSLNITDITCKGESSGSTNLSLSGGTSPYNITWQNALRQTIGTHQALENEAVKLENLAEGLYHFRVSDDSGCEYYQSGFSFAVEGPQNGLSLKTNKTDITCYGDNDGSVELQSVGGWSTSSYKYGVNDLSSLNVNHTLYENLTPDTYTFYVEDGGGCVDNVSVTIEEPDLLELTATPTNLTCHQANNGKVSLLAKGGRSPYQYHMDGGIPQSVPIFENLSNGNYLFEVIDSYGCTSSIMIPITQPEPLTINIIDLMDTKCSENFGKAKSEVLGGTAPYTYEWINIEGTLLSSQPSINDLLGGEYSLKVTDANNCDQTTSFIILNTNDIKIATPIVKDVSCFGKTNGEIDLTVLESTPPLTIQWSQGSTSNAIHNLSAGTYTVSLKDAAGCAINETIVVSSPEPLDLVETRNQSPTCHEGCDGLLAVEALHGTAPYSYKWQVSDGEDQASIDNRCAGDYIAQVTDKNGCLYEETFTIMQIEKQTLDLGDSAVICEGQEVHLDPGVWKSYHWSSLNGFSSKLREVTLTNEGIYTLAVTDEKDCPIKGDYEVIISTELLDADFLIPSEAYVGDTVVCIDITWPEAHEITWEFDQVAIKSISEDGAFHEIEMLKEGAYSIAMNANLGGCKDQEIYYINVLSENGEKQESIAGRLGDKIEDIIRYDLYPNPNSGSFWCEIELNQVSPINLSVTDLTGSDQLYSYYDAGSDEYTIKLNISDIPTGVYFLRLSTPLQSKVLRLAIQ